MPNTVLRCYRGDNVAPERWVIVLNGIEVAELSVDYYTYMELWMQTSPVRIEVEYVEV
jgi:hypothetical protein